MACVPGLSELLIFFDVISRSRYNNKPKNYITCIIRGLELVEPRFRGVQEIALSERTGGVSHGGHVTSHRSDLSSQVYPERVLSLNTKRVFN